MVVNKVVNSTASITDFVSNCPYKHPSRCLPQGSLLRCKWSHNYFLQSVVDLVYISTTFLFFVLESLIVSQRISSNAVIYVRV